jgi:ribonuclease PH
VDPVKLGVAAISVGIVKGQTLLDLNYGEDSHAEVDANIVMTDKGEFIEVQGTAEGKPFSRTRLDELLATAEKGIRELHELQRRNV